MIIREEENNLPGFFESSCVSIKRAATPWRVSDSLLFISDTRGNEVSVFPQETLTSVHLLTQWILCLCTFAIVDFPLIKILNTIYFACGWIKERSKEGPEPQSLTKELNFSDIYVVYDGCWTEKNTENRNQELRTWLTSFQRGLLDECCSCNNRDNVRVDTHLTACTRTVATVCVRSTFALHK